VLLLMLDAMQNLDRLPFTGARSAMVSAVQIGKVSVISSKHCQTVRYGDTTKRVIYRISSVI
jgi:hypothetical protein